MFMSFVEDAGDAMSLVVGEFRSLRVLQRLSAVSKTMRWMATNEDMVVLSMRRVKLEAKLFDVLHLPKPMVDTSGNVSRYNGTTFAVLLNSITRHSDFQSGLRVKGSYVVNLRHLHTLKMQRCDVLDNIIRDVEHRDGPLRLCEREILQWGMLVEYRRTGRLVEPWAALRMPTESMPGVYENIDNTPSDEDVARCGVRAFRIHSKTMTTKRLSLQLVVEHLLFEANIYDPDVCNIKSLFCNSCLKYRSHQTKELLRLLGLGDDKMIYPLRLKDFVGENLETGRPMKLTGEGILYKLRGVLRVYQCEVDRTPNPHPQP